MEGGDGETIPKPSPGGSEELSERELWEHLWSVARYDLQISEEEFWRLTPRALDALLARRKAANDREQLFVAQLRADVINFSACHPKRPVKLEDLLPKGFWKHEGNTGADAKRMSPKRREVLADRVREVMNLFGE